MRQELDLRLGASFTRFNTLLLQNAFRLPGSDATGRGAVGPGRCCSPRHPTHFESSFIESYGIL